MVYTLYKHIFPNNKIYIGITSLSVNIRWGNGKGYREQPLMSKAIKKYGWKNIKHEVLFTVNNKLLIEKLERLYITKIYHSYDIKFGYNMQLGGLNKGFRPDYINKNVGKALKGENNPNYGKHWWTNGIDNILAKEALDSSWKRGSHYFENKPRKSAVKGKKCWTNGIENKYSIICPGKDWVLGRAKLTKEQEQHKQETRRKTMLAKYGVEHSNYIPEIREKHRKTLLGKKIAKDLHWFNNGVKQTLSKVCPKGFIPGMLKKTK